MPVDLMDYLEFGLIPFPDQLDTEESLVLR